MFEKYRLVAAKKLDSYCIKINNSYNLTAYIDKKALNSLLKDIEFGKSKFIEIRDNDLEGFFIKRDELSTITWDQQVNHYCNGFKYESDMHTKMSELQKCGYVIEYCGLISEDNND